MATVKLEKGQKLDEPLLLEPTHRFSEAEELQFESSLVYPTENRCAVVMLTNPTDFTQKLKQGVWVGRASEAEIISEDSQEILSENEGEGASSEQHVHDQTRVCVVTAEESAEQRKQKLAKIVCNEGADFPWQERSQLHSLLLERHQAFSLEDGEWGETSLVEMHIDTGIFPK